VFDRGKILHRNNAFSGNGWGMEVLAGRRIGLYSGGAFNFNYQNHVGSTRMMDTYASSGSTVVENCTELPFGDAGACSGSKAGFDWFYFTDFLSDADGESASRTRRYSVTQGRWQVPDPSGLAAVDITNPQTWNRYAYVANNPVSYVDPTGLQRLRPGECDASQIDCTGGAGLGGGGGTYAPTYGWIDGGCLLGCDGDASFQPGALDWAYWGMDGVLFVPGVAAGNLISDGTIGGASGSATSGIKGLLNCTIKTSNKITITNAIAQIPEVGSFMPEGSWARAGVDVFGGNAISGLLATGQTLFGNSANGPELAQSGVGILLDPSMGLGPALDAGGMSIPSVIGTLTDTVAEGATGVGLFKLGVDFALTLGSGAYCALTSK
jgi:RHS repeat-associated protein